ncbi:Protein-S-isoprenylcysteine O-methyltransferase Ste14 [Mariprofundus ferrinatatus]|uniref:Protein-S-isoprenylcysteine O-methyltransferase Ste14 n=1 Tax=Mariprofundus ferrinatatus TaxID=1921087 RepID=A0A2K8L9M7_9PROT|nr:isoprenylcysteine carboxylmethyltransferase family protein [Mariprofundus ferrinatatus]ATX81644.1 Protein-S-isoprenylcysteine O-methyltransferase Ste14 [Mariprofundus ferrinatatus]
MTRHEDKLLILSVYSHDSAMERLKLKVPPLPIAIICGLMIWGLSVFIGTHSMGIEIRRIIAIVLLIAAATVDLAALITLLRNKTTVDPRYPEKSSSVVTTGIYRFSRNPMYLGLALLLTSLSLWLGVRFGLFVVMGFILYMNRFQIEPEEQALEKQFGERYINYKSTVRRWL